MFPSPQFNTVEKLDVYLLLLQVKIRIHKQSFLSLLRILIFLFCSCTFFAFSSVAQELENADTALFQSATKNNTIESYNVYLQQYPAGMHVEEAYFRKEELRFTLDSQENTIESYERYLSQYPQGRYTQKAHQQREHLLYQQAKERNSIPLYKKYYSEYPKGKRREEVVLILEKDAYFSNVMAIQSNEVEKQSQELLMIIQKTNQYFLQYPNGKYTPQAKEIADDFILTQVRSYSAVPTLETYLTHYPDGKDIKEIRAELKELYWQETIRSNTLTAYLDFITRYPQSPYLPEAKKRYQHRLIMILFDPEAQDYDLKEKFLELELEQINSAESRQEYVIRYRGTLQADQLEEEIYREVSQENTIESYHHFLQKNPFSPRAALALSASFALYRSQNRILSYDQFIALYPTSQQAQSAIREQWKLYQQAGKVSQYREFIRKYPESQLVEEAIASIYRLYEAVDLPNGYRQFIALYPHSPQTPKAISQLFQHYRKQKLIKGYWNFLMQYPNSPQALQAFQQIQRIALSRARTQGILGLEEYERAFPYSPYSKNIYDQIYQREKVGWITGYQRLGVSPKNAEIVAKQMVSSAQKAARIGDYWIADRRYSILLSETPFSTTKLALQIVTSSKLQKNTENFLKYQQQIEENTQQIQELWREIKTTNAVESKWNDHQFGKYADLLTIYHRAVENAEERAKKRSETTYRIYLLLVGKHSKDLESCEKAESWVCNRL